MQIKNLALFDLDHTLLEVDSDYLWGEYLVRHHLVDEATYRAKNQEFYQQYIAGTLDAVAYNEFVASFLAKHSLKNLHQWRDDYLKTDIIPNIRPKAKQTLDQHLANGDDVVIISATNDFIVSAIAEQFFVPTSHVLATKLAQTATGYTGKLLDRPNFQDGKIYHLQQWLIQQQQHGIQYQKTFAYSDSKNDLPLLTWADVAICVCPDDALKQHALTQGWSIVDWSLTA